MNNDDTAVGDENLLPTALTKLTLDWLEFTLTQTSGGGAIALDIKYCKSAETLERERVRNSLRQSIAIGCSGAQDGNLLDAAAQTASDLEAALFRAYYFAHEAVYHSKVRALCENLARNASYLLSHFDAEILAYFPSEALAGGTALDQWRAKYRHTLSQKLQAQRKERKGIFECPKCHSNNTDHYSSQTRGADEPATIFVECLSCNKNFRR